MSYEKKHRERQALALDDRPRPQRAKKDTKRWCKGHAGREHVPQTERPKWTTRPCELKGDSSWWPSRTSSIPDDDWRCNHQLVCVNCGKILEYFLDAALCPDRP